MRRAFSFVLAVLVTASFNLIAAAQSKTRTELREEITSKGAELAILEEQFLEPSEADRNEFAELLRQPHSGLIRLLPREKFDSETYKTIKKTMTMRGGGAYYSFSRRTHEYGFGSDIELDHDTLSVGFAGADYGMLVNVGEVPLQEISMDSPSVFLLAKYYPPRAEPDARVEQRRFSTGTTIEDQPFKNRLPVEVHATYLLRSICYEDSDVLVALKVARRDSDGSLIIAWKLLHKFSVPKLARNN